MVRVSDADETYFFQTFSASSQTSLKARLQRAYLRFRGFSDKPCLMLIGHEGEAETVIWAQRRTEAICKSLGALPIGTGAGHRWYHGRFASPYVRDPLMDHGLGIDTLETSTRWSNIGNLHKAVIGALNDAMDANMPETGGRGIVMAHLSHSYPDGASLYFSFIFPRQLDREIEQWQALKRAASDAILENRGTISHHHGVGADHVPWLAEEKGPVGYEILRSVKRELDPTGIMNPGKLLG
jgi:alkyldihydroxyacetonephosphate synthase